MKESILLLGAVLSFMTVRGSILCSETSPDLCIGFSGDYPRVSQQLQLKSRKGLMLKNNTVANWTVSPNKTNVTLLAKWPLVMGGSDNKDLVRLLNDTNARAFLSNGTVQIPGNLCVTPMQCRSRGNDYCDPSSTVLAPPLKLRKGSFLRWRKCAWLSNQRFVIDPPCAEGCSLQDQLEKSCKTVCITEYCLQTGNYTCPVNGTRTDNPTNAPTSMPSLGPSFRPTAMPSPQPWSKPTAMPSDVPTSEVVVVTNSPSKSPVRPTMAPTLHPTLTDSPTSSPALSPTKSEAPSLRPTTVTNPPTEDVGTSSPITMAPTVHTYWDEFVGTLVALVIVSCAFFLLLWLLLLLTGKCDRKENFVMKPPPTPVPAPTTSNSPHVLQNLPYELFTYTNNLGPVDDQDDDDAAVKVTTPTPPLSDAGSTVIV